MKPGSAVALWVITVAVIFFRGPAPALARAQQDRLGIPQSAAQPSYTLTHRGNIDFQANVAGREPDGSSRVLLTEIVEITGVKNPQGWIGFVHSFAASTGDAFLNAMPAAAGKKKGKVVVAFTLHHDGSMDGGVTLEHSSGDATMDNATRLAVAEAAPFAALPQNFVSASAQIRVTFQYKHPHPLALATGAQP